MVTLCIVLKWKVAFHSAVGDMTIVDLYITLQQYIATYIITNKKNQSIYEISNIDDTIFLF